VGRVANEVADEEESDEEGKGDADKDLEGEGGRAAGMDAGITGVDAGITGVDAGITAGVIGMDAGRGARIWGREGPIGSGEEGMTEEGGRKGCSDSKEVSKSYPSSSEEAAS
jgi:hypothetical protein